jgi:flagellar biosynthetic protein FliO
MDNPQGLPGRLYGQFKKNPKWVWGLAILLTIVIIALVVKPGQDASNRNLLTDPAVNTTSLAVDVFLKFGIVIAVIYLGFYLLRNWQLHRPGAVKKQLGVLETLYLNPRRSIYLVQAGSRKLVIGATDQSVSLLTEILPDEETGLGAVISSGEDGEFSHILEMNLKP